MRTATITNISIPTFTGNTEALAGGLTVGTLYKTTLGVVMIVI